MVDSSPACESKYLDTDTVRNSPTKRLIILDEGQFKEQDFEGEKYNALVLNVEIDGKRKEWKPNRDSASNLKSGLGADTKGWVGKPILVQVIKVRGRDSILATPGNLDPNQLPPK